MQRKKYDRYDIVKTQTASLGRFEITLDMVEKDGNQYPYSYLNVKNSISILPIELIG